MTDLVLSEDRGAVRHVVLNRPEKRNAFNGDLVLAVGRALREAAASAARRREVERLLDGSSALLAVGEDRDRAWR